jgi:hypothetical protein
MLRGDEPYKQHWRVREEATYRIQLPRMIAYSSLVLDSIAA